MYFSKYVLASREGLAGPGGPPLRLVLHFAPWTGIVSSTGGNDSSVMLSIASVANNTNEPPDRRCRLARLLDKMRLTFIVHSGNLLAASEI